MELNETTLNRVRSHFNSDRPVAILTAFRGSFTYNDNVKRNKQLAAELKRNGYGYVFVDGHWVEKNGGNIDDSKEDSILAIGNENDSGKLKKLVIDQMKKYDQDAVLFKDTNSKDIVLLFQDGNVEKLGKFSPDKVAQAYTKLRGRGGRSFVFEELREDRTWLERLSKQIG
jgi:hypothetical protein